MATSDMDLSRAAWRTSTYSNNGGACVEVASNLPGTVAVRDSKNSDGATLTFTTGSWQAFIDGIKIQHVAIG